MADEGVRQERVTFLILDALRGWAALLVVLYHARYLFGPKLAPNGYLAVDLFFALSGFVIAHSYDGRLAAGMGTLRFALLRLIRFYPLYLVGLGLGFLFELLLVVTHNHYAMEGWKILASGLLGLFFLPTLHPTREMFLFPLNVVSWSLMFELIINIGYAALFRRLTMRTLIVLAIVSGAALLTFAVRAGTMDVGSRTMDLAAGLARATFSFTVGVIIYRSGARNLPIAPWLLIAAMIVLMVWRVPAALRLPHDLLFVFIVSPATVLAGASGSRRRVSHGSLRSSASCLMRSMRCTGR